MASASLAIVGVILMIAGVIFFWVPLIGILFFIMGIICLIASPFAGRKKETVVVTQPQPTIVYPPPTQAGKIYCSRCGAENPAEATYCHKCGNRLRS